MQPGIKYKVTDQSSGHAIGHFLDDIYYEPFGGDKRMGHIDHESNLVYYLVRQGETPSVLGNYSAGVLVRKDGLRFQVTPDAQ